MKYKKYLSYIFTIIVISLIFVFSIIFALVNINNNKMYSGISIKGVDISGLTKDEAINTLNEFLSKKLSDDIILKKDDFEISINPEQIDLKINIEKAVNEAYNIGRSGNIVKNNYEIIGSFFSKRNIDAEISYNTEMLEKLVSELNSKIPNALEESSYYIEGNTLIISKGKSGNIINKDDLINKIDKEIKSDFITDKLNVIKQTYIEISVEEKTVGAINIEKIHEEIYKEAKNAYINESPFEVHPHVEGVDFAIGMEEVYKILEKDQAEYEIPLKIVKPAITTDKLGAKAFPNLIATYSTKFDASNKDRSTNLELAMEKINNTVVMPGSVFSYNKVVGARTIAAGYKEAPIYQGGKVVDGLGGGICQISSTLYNSVLYANLEIVERSNHRFLTSYVSAGRDATVAYGSIDFKFKNTRKYPIKITCAIKSGIAQIDIYGIKEENEYEVIIQTKVTDTINYETVYEEDASKEIGTETVKQKGANGCKSETYKILKQNGAVVSKTILSKDSYSAMQRIIVKGTKNAKKEEATNEIIKQDSNEVVNNTTENTINTTNKTE